MVNMVNFRLCVFYHNLEKPVQGKCGYKMMRPHWRTAAILYSLSCFADINCIRHVLTSRRQTMTITDGAGSTHNGKEK